VIIHTREAESETIEILRSEFAETKLGGIFHCFSGSLELAQAALELGFMISFSGILTFKTAADLREVAEHVPLARMLIETDCPYLSPIPYRGKRNEPAYVIEVARTLGELYDVELEAMAFLPSDNFRRFFGLS
jgi:TatD DNase family protein